MFDQYPPVNVGDGLPEVAAAAPGLELAATVTGLDPAELDDGGLIDTAAAWEKLIAWAQAGQLRVLAELARRRPNPNDPESLRGEGIGVNEFTADEIAPALHISRYAADNRLRQALSLSRRLPNTLAALGCGELNLAKAGAIDETTLTLPQSAAEAVEQRVLPRAADQTVGQLRACLRRAVLKVDPKGAQERHEQRKTERRVEVHDQDDGMAALWAPLAAHHARAIYDLLTDMARAAKTPDDARTMDQRRADALVDLCLGTGTSGGITARAQVTVSASTLLGLDDQPSELAGYGPIPAQMARELAADGTWRRLLTDPASGALLDYGRSTYTPPAALADLVRARDARCRFPGCRQPAWRGDLDHTVPYPKGPTAPHNLAVLCRHHHRLKHEAGWAVEQHPDGRLVWTTPTGHRYTTTPPTVGPDPPDASLFGTASPITPEPEKIAA